MLIMDTRKYKFTITIQEGNDEFWEEIRKKPSGADDVFEELRSILNDRGFVHGDNCWIRLEKYYEDASSVGLK